ncbi:hypothetical protein ABZT45_36115 [Streptomyces sp. NPDC005356]
MRRAAAFTDEHVSYRGAYVWSYLPDLSTTWGEMEAKRTMLGPPGTPSVGHSRLDAYHATGDETFYRAAERTGLALVEAQLRVPSAAGPPALPPVPARTSHGPLTTHHADQYPTAVPLLPAHRRPRLPAASATPPAEPPYQPHDSSEGITTSACTGNMAKLIAYVAG